MFIRSIPDLEMFIQDFCEYAKEKIPLCNDPIRIKINEEYIIIEIDTHCDDALLVNAFKTKFFSYSVGDTTYSFTHSYLFEICQDIFTLINQYVYLRISFSFREYKSQAQQQFDRIPKEDQRKNSSILPTITHHEIIMNHLNLLVALLDRTSNWYTAAKSTMTMYVSNVPSASLVIFQLEKFMNAKDKFSSNSLQELISLLNERRKHIHILEEYKKEKEYIDVILNSDKSLLNENKNYDLPTSNSLDDSFVFINKI